MMSDQSSIFPDQAATNQVSATQAPANPLDALLAGIKNEAGVQKYSTLEDALKALQHSQAYIPELANTLKAREAELATAKAEAAKVAELEKSVQLLLNPSAQAPAPPASKGMSQEDVAAIVNQTLTKKQAEDAAAANINSVVHSVRERFGDKAESTFYEKAAQLGLSKDAINQLAATSPTAALTLLGLDKNVSNQRQPGGFNTDGLKPSETSLVGRNKKSIMFGATGNDLKNESANVKAMITELDTHGLSIHDMTDPKNFFKYFSN